MPVIGAEGVLIHDRPGFEADFLARGSLPPATGGDACDTGGFAACMEEEYAETVRRQVEAGIDISSATGNITGNPWCGTSP